MSEIDSHEEHEHFNLAAIGGFLVVLTAASFSTYFLEDAAWWGRGSNMLFVLMISFCKASLVVGFFMHFRYEKLWKYFLTIPPCVLGVGLTLALLPDIAYSVYTRIGWSQLGP